ncbi:MAG TPA: MaoC/PaaZ C-terminal domain-containing protein [Beutenbergiaceae bacterium]|nr:MaoC/PaaZ C-terminal domain-containing protein [Beutenbergiaceae bacterium]
MPGLPADVEPGAELFSVPRTIDRDRLVRYAGASGDFNPIHYNDRFARDVGLPGVIAHGMLTMGLAGSALSDHLGDPADVLEFSTRFTRPVPVPDPGEVQVQITATVRSVHEHTAVVDLAVQVEGRAVLGKAQAVVRLR